MNRCKNHPVSMDGFNGSAYCQECGRMIYAQLKLCEQCSKYLDKCEICCDNAESEINPTLVKAYNAPESIKARNLRRTAVELLNGPYADALRTVYQSLTTPAFMALDDALKPLKAKLAADLDADSAYQAAMQAYSEALVLPTSEANSKVFNQASAVLAAARKPHTEAMDVATAPLLATYKETLVPFEAVGQAVWTALTASTAKLIGNADATLEKILAEARSASEA